MNHIEISQLLIYPIKSTQGVPLDASLVQQIGLKNDRTFAIIDTANNIITGRENPKLLKITARLTEEGLRLTSNEDSTIDIDPNNSELEEVSTILFKNEVKGLLIKDEINQWISDVIGEPAKLIQLNTSHLRTVKEKYNGKEGDVFAFDDAAPINLMTEESLAQVNHALQKPVGSLQFRPNIIVKGGEAFEEDHWKYLKIGNCEFEKATETARCSFINIDPKTFLKDKDHEPLKTLSKIRKSANKVKFGIYLIPRKLGQIKVGDEVEVS